MWYDHPIGRITEYLLGKQTKCTETKFSTPLVNFVIQYSSPSTSAIIPFLKGVVEMKKEQKASYRNKIEKHHSDFPNVQQDYW